MAGEVSLEGPVELIDGKLTLQIPLAAGGDKLALEHAHKRVDDIPHVSFEQVDV